jgi:membrane associated rhomboid family serine protease
MSGNLHKRGKQLVQHEGMTLLIAMVVLMWAVEIVNKIDSQGLDGDGGIYARNVGRIWAIFTAPWLHAGFHHLEANTVPFVFMGFIIAFRGVAKLALVTAIVVVLGGLGTWLTAPSNSVTVGASGIVFGYAAYLLFSGLFNRSAVELLLGAVVAVVWGGALLSSLVPHYGISWQGHASGAVGGLAAAWLLSRDGREKSGKAAGGVPAFKAR